MTEKKKSPGIFDWAFFIGCIAFLGYWLYGIIESGFFGGWQPSEQLVRGLVLGAFLGLGVGAILILKALWRKLFQRTPVQRL